MTNDSAGKHAPIPLVKRLVAAGMGSRRKAAALIMSGVVAVNGERALNLNHPVSNADVVTVKGARTARAEERRVYLLLNKPKDYLSTVTDSRGRPTILQLIPPAFRVAGLVPAGRLDAESTGLMLLTNDGPLVDRITHPRYGVVKEYDVLLDKQLSPSDRRRLTDGIEIESGLGHGALRDGEQAGRPALRHRTHRGQETRGAADDASARAARTPADARPYRRLAARHARARRSAGDLGTGRAKGSGWLTQDVSSG